MNITLMCNCNKKAYFLFKVASKDHTKEQISKNGKEIYLKEMWGIWHTRF